VQARAADIDEAVLDPLELGHVGMRH